MRNYIVGITVDSADELAAISPKLRAFIEEVGEGTAEIQLAIGAQGGGGYEEKTPAIGFAVDGVDYYEEDEGEDD